MPGHLWKTAVIGTVLSGVIGAMSAPPLMGAGAQPRFRALLACEGGVPGDENPDQVLEWNQIFIDTLIATNTANSSSQRLGAIVHTAIFDAYNGIEKRYTHVRVEPDAPAGASRRAAVVAAAHRALVGLFPSQQTILDAYYVLSLAALGDEGSDGGQSRARGIEWGEEVADAVLAWRATDGFTVSRPAFTGGSVIGQWRPTPPAFGPMSAQGLAFTQTFVLEDNTQFAPPSPRGLDTQTYVDDFNAVKALGRRTDQRGRPIKDALAVFWEGNASVHWNQAANQIACANTSRCPRQPVARRAGYCDGRHRVYHLARQARVRRRSGRSDLAAGDRDPLADTDGNDDTIADPDWLPSSPPHRAVPRDVRVRTARVAATVLLMHFDDAQMFTLTTAGRRARTSKVSDARSDGNNGRVWGGMHYPSTVAISDAMGETIAHYVNGIAMQRVHGHGR